MYFNFWVSLKLKSLISDPLILIMAGVCRMNPAADISKAQKDCLRNGLSILTGLKLSGQRKYLPQHKIVFYGYYYAESEKVAKAVLRAGYSDMVIYNQFITEWSSNIGLPMQHLERFPQLVYPHWIQTLISGGMPPHYNNSKFVICHAHYRNRDAYLGGHIPGAIDIDTLALESPDTWNRRSPEELKEALEKHGITSDTTVILYGKFLFPNNADPFPGSRCRAYWCDPMCFHYDVCRG